MALRAEENETQAGGAAAAAAVAAAAAAPRRCALDRRLVAAGFLLHIAFQLAALRHLGPLPVGEILQSLSLQAGAATLWLAVTWRPAFYIKWRHAFLLTYPVAAAACTVSSSKGAVAGVPWALLDVLPSSGPRVILQDVVTVICGSGLLTAVLSTFLVPLPLLPHLLAQALNVAAVVRGSSSLCVVPLLAHPLAEQRMAAFHQPCRCSACQVTGVRRCCHVSQYAAGTGAYTAAVLSGGQREQQCASFVTFLATVVGLVLPTVLLAKTGLPACSKHWEEGGGGGSSIHRHAQGASSGTSSSGGSSGSLAATEACLQRAVRLLAGRSWRGGGEMRGPAGLMTAAAAPAAAAASPGLSGAAAVGQQQRSQQRGQQRQDQLLLLQQQRQDWCEEGEEEGDSWLAKELPRALSWWLLLCYCHALAAAVS